MLIDWFTVAAQVINFLILVWLLKRFLYQPILAAIDAREQKIANELKNASERQNEAKLERDTFQEKNVEFDQQQQARLKNATESAEVERQSLLTAARAQADELSAKREASLSRQEQNLQSELRHLACAEVFAIARKALQDLASVSLEQSMVELFLAKLNTMDDKIKKSFAAAMASAIADGQVVEPLWVRSAFALSDEQQVRIKSTFNTIFAAELPLRFEAAPKLISGIEVKYQGQKIAWSISEYFRSLEKSISDLLTTASVSSAEIPAPDQSGSTSSSAIKSPSGTVNFS